MRDRLTEWRGLLISEGIADDRSLAVLEQEVVDEVQAAAEKVTYGALVSRAWQAAQKAERKLGIKVELIDLCTLNPYDWDAIATSVRKTSRVIVAHEDTLS